MFIGRIQTLPYMNRLGISPTRSNGLFAPKQTALRQYDRLEMGTPSLQNSSFGIYKPSSNQMRAIESTPCTKIAPDSRLQRELLPPSEQAAYTEEDALVNQYMKQSRIDGYFDGNTFMRTSSEPVKLILKDNLTAEDLEQFQSKLAEQGLGTEIDWRGVENDFVQIGVDFDNIEHFEQKADYLASRYAVLKDRIENQFIGDKQEAELQKLEQIFAKAKEEMAAAYGNSVGKFFEDLGQSKTAENMENSVLALIEQKANAYTDFIAKTDIYANITAPDKQWLKQDDAYMAAQLRASAAASSASQTQSAKTETLYTAEDLSFAGVYAKALSQQLQNPTWNVEKSDAALGEHLAAQLSEMQNTIERANISENLSKMLTASFNPFMDRLMDSLDTLIDRNQERAAAKPWIAGMLRTAHIDRENVCHAFQKALSQA